MKRLACLKTWCAAGSSMPSLQSSGDKLTDRNAGVVTYFYITNDGFLQPEVE